MLLDEIQTIAQQIEDSQLRDRVLVDLARVLVESARSEGDIFSVTTQVMNLISQIEDNSLRVLALAEVVKVLTNFGGASSQIQALDLVRQEWRQATEREDAIRLLSLSYPLIPLKSSAGVEFAEAFDWVDQLLKWT
jgi:hypothetical protein